MIDIEGKTALVTGSSRGVGQQIALGLAKLGCNVIVHGRTEQNCLKTLELLKEFNIASYCVYGELSDQPKVNEVINQVKQLKLQVDILYNNAAIGTTYKSNIWAHDLEEWMQIIKVNVFSMYTLCGAFIPEMIKNGFGRVINITSGIKHQPELMPYGVSKAAVDKLTDDLSVKLENSGVRINTLDPGWLQTDMGGENAEYPVEATLPGALAPVLVDNDGPNGKFFSAINHDLKINWK
jgi:NAD(P)-dependent dehydrogenase (short-subunit alcohol dehydrogenase family)